MRWCYQSTRRARSRRSTAPSRACRSSPARSGPGPTTTSAREHHPVRRAQRARRGRARPLHAEAHTPGVHPLPECGRPPAPHREVGARPPRQLRNPQAPQSQGLGWRHPLWTFHFTPTSSSWLNAVENFFSVLTRRRLSRGVIKSVVDLQAAINRYLEEHNSDPKPFVWTKPAKDILAKVKRLPAPSV
jgi:hypothetical protein